MEEKTSREGLQAAAGYGIIILLHKLNIFDEQQMRFCPLAKTRVPLHLLFIVDVRVCVATSGALRFSCVASFEAAHFLL